MSANECEYASASIRRGGEVSNPRFRLVSISSSCVPEKIVPGRDEVVIGTDPAQCDIALEGTWCAFVSRRHVCLALINDKLHIKDMQSLNG